MCPLLNGAWSQVAKQILKMLKICSLRVYSVTLEDLSQITFIVINFIFIVKGSLYAFLCKVGPEGQLQMVRSARWLGMVPWNGRLAI